MRYFLFIYVFSVEFIDNSCCSAYNCFTKTNFALLGGLTR